eukprot:g6925.t1
MRSVHYRYRYLQVLCLSVSVWLRTASSDTLEQVQVIARHGARTILSKDAVTLAEGGASLTRDGQKQQVDLGREVRKAYMTGAGSFSTAYEADEAWLSSSDFDRTLSSAMGFSNGVWPQNDSTAFPSNLTTFIPVHSVRRENDIDILAYRNCPEFVKRLHELYASSPFVAQEKDNRQFLKDIASLYPGLMSPEDVREGYLQLKNIWNVFDTINVRKDLSPDDSMSKKISDSQFAKLKNLTAWVEHRRYGNDVAANLLGSNLWQTILGRVKGIYEQATVAEQAKLKALPKHKVIFYAAHYPTILGLFATFDLFETNKAFLSSTSVPNYASALVIEVWKKSGGAASEQDLYIKLKFKDGDRVPLSNAPYLSLSTSCTATSCPVSAFKKAIEAKTLFKTEWCTECGNTAAQDCSDAPKKLTRSGFLAMLDDLSGGAGIAIGICVGILIAVLSTCILKRLRDRKKYTLHSSRETEGKQEMVSFNAVAEL